MIAANTAILAMATALWLSAPAALLAQKHHISMEEGLPLEVEDAYPSPYRDWELELPFRYDRTRDQRDSFLLHPEVAYGVIRNGEISIGVPIRFGSADKTGSGDIETEAFYNFNTEGLILPALALKAVAILPTGLDNNGLDTRFRLIATKSISNRLDRLHVNVQLDNNADPLPDERHHRWTFIIGYSRGMGPDMMLVADVVREQDREKDEASNIVELGMRRMLTPLAVLSTAVGTGFGDQSPRFRFVLGIQIALTPALVY